MQRMFVTVAVFAAVAIAQTGAEPVVERVFRVSHAQTEDAIQELATLIRSVSDIRDLSAHATNRSLAVRGTAGQIALAEWLFHELDQPSNRRTVAPVYRVPGGDEVVRVFYLAHATTPQQAQEVATIVRSVADVPRVFLYRGTGAVAVRGPAAKIAMAEWILNVLDRPVDQQPPAKHEYRAAEAGNDVVRVFYTTPLMSAQDFQELATQVRSIANIRRVFTYFSTRALTVRGTAAQIAMADWLVAELNKPSNWQPPPQPRRTAASPEYRAPESSDDVLRVFYLASDRTPQEVAVAIRKTAEIRRLFTHTTLKALTLRGTAHQITVAEGLLR